MTTLNEEQTQSYLAYLGLEYPPPSPSYDLLCRLIEAHYYTIPFESLSLHIPPGSRGPIPHQAGLGSIYISPEAVISKICSHRGGYCFELNGTFASLLDTIGFNTTHAIARVFEFQKQDPKVSGWQWSPLSHRITLVHLGNQIYHCDVGFGTGQPPIPIPLCKHSITTAQEEFILEHGPLPPWCREDDAPGYTLYHRFASSSITSPLYHVYKHHTLPQDFALANFATSHDASGLFGRMLMATLPMRNGDRWTLVGDGRETKFEIRATNGEIKERRMLKDMEELREVLVSMNIQLK